MAHLEKTLEDLGLAEKEARVYIASIELGPTSVQKIAQLAECNRVTTYVILENLIQKGLIAKIERGKKSCYTAENPTRLTLLLDRMHEDLAAKKDLLEKILPELATLKSIAGNKPIVRVFEEKSGLIRLRDEYLQTTKTGGEILSFIPLDYLYVIFPPGNKKTLSKRVAKKIGARIIYTTKKDQHLNTEPALIRETRYVPHATFPFTSGVDIYSDNKIALINYRDRLMGVVIESKELHDSFKLIFNLAWEGAEKYQEK